MQEHNSKSDNEIAQNRASLEKGHYHYLDRLDKTTAKRNNICFTIASAFIGYSVYFSKSLNFLASKDWLLFSLVFFISTLISLLVYYILAENELLRRIEFLPRYYSGAPASEEEKGASFLFANFLLKLSPILLVLGIITFSVFSYKNLGSDVKKNKQEVLEAASKKKHLPKSTYLNSIKDKSLPPSSKEELPREPLLPTTLPPKTGDLQ